MLKNPSTALLFVALLFTTLSTKSQILTILHFDPNWCPRPVEIADLSRYMNLRMNGCCVRQAVVFNEYRSSTEVLQKWEHRFAEASAFDSTCTGRVLTAQEAAEDDTKQRRLALEAVARRKADIQQALLDAEREEAQRRRDAPKLLRGLPKEAFCLAVGSATRESSVDGIGTYPELAALVRKEAARRGIALDFNLVLKRSIRIGASDCQLFAALGLPERQNRTVSRSGVHVQHVYRTGLYVYTENGRITAWQD